MGIFANNAKHQSTRIRGIPRSASDLRREGDVFDPRFKTNIKAKDVK